MKIAIERGFEFPEKIITNVCGLNFRINEQKEGDLINKVELFTLKCHQGYDSLGYINEKKKGQYELPGGKVDNEDDTIQDTLVREIAYEEIGMPSNGIIVGSEIKRYCLLIMGKDREFIIYSFRFNEELPEPEKIKDRKNYERWEYIPFPELHVKNISPLINMLINDQDIILSIKDITSKLTRN
ncbi:MAG: NUDIX domain-containing protein [Nanoarchaeota archaeon]|nr:NUDIX domain-containing protein [Nanoarchaeota archaeon]